MRKEYVGYSKIEFEQKLLGISLLVGCKEFKDITDDLIYNGYRVWERVYESEIGNEKIRIYSTIDIRTNWTRDVGQDTVKVIILRIDDGQEKYQKAGKHIRIHTLFDNLKKTLENVIMGNVEGEFTSDLMVALK